MKIPSIFLFGFFWLILGCLNNSNQTINKKDATFDSDSLHIDTSSLIIDYLKIFDSYSVDYNYDWHGISKSPTYYGYDCSKISDLLKKERNIFELYPNAGYFINHLKLLDFNADGEKDIIYSGPSGIEPDEVVFVMGYKNNLKKILTLRQGVVKVDWKNDRISKIYSHDWDCCAGTDLINSVYEINYDSTNFPDIKKVFQSIEYKFMAKPIHYFDKPVQFKVDSTKSALRFSPEVDDTSYFHDYRVGNKIGFANSGAEGSAYGQKKDKYGVIWWYVIVNPNQITVQNILYLKDLDMPTHVIGWIKSNELIKK